MTGATVKPKPRRPAAGTPTLVGMGSRLKRRNYGRNHAYYLDGEVKLSGVTTLIGDGMRKKALENWAGNETASYAVDHWDELAMMSPTKRFEVLKGGRFKSRDEAARRGTEIHRLAELITNGQEVDVPEEIRGHVESAVRFLDEWEIESILTEFSVYHERGGYAGTGDGVARSRKWSALKGEDRVILYDWKSSRSGIYGETALQLAAYGNDDCMFQDEHGVDTPVSSLGITDHWAVWIRSDGYDVYPMERGPEVFRTFQYVATVARRTGGEDRPLDRLKGEALFLPSGVKA